jgi:threonine dehydrogenase-like Zn-dependent dehydrogenase
VPRILPCGDCERCRRGQVAACAARRERHGLASHETVPVRFLCALEPPLWCDGEELWRYAALADALATPYSALARVGLMPNEPLLIVGGGARAQLAARLAEARGAQPVLDGGRRPGAKIVELSGASAGRKQVLALCAEGCTLALCDGPVPLRSSPIATDWGELVAAEVQIHGLVGSHPDLLPELAALVVRGVVPLAPSLLRVSLGEAAHAHAAYHAGELVALPVLVLDGNRP